MPYEAVLLDADDTLLDFHASQREACKKLFAHLGLPAAKVLPRYDAINEGLWKQLEKGLLTAKELRTRRFELLFAEYPCPYDPAQASSLYVELLSRECFVFPQAPALLQYLKRNGYKTAVVSNGFYAVQTNRLRLSGLLPYLDAVIISEKVGVQKPDPRMVYAALDALHIQNKAKALLLGDSLSSDMAAAKNAGIRGIWYDPYNKPLPQGAAFTAIGSLPELIPILQKEIHP